MHRRRKKQFVGSWLAAALFSAVAATACSDEPLQPKPSGQAAAQVPTSPSRSVTGSGITMTDLGTLGGSGWSHAHSLNNAGIVVGYTNMNNFRWDPATGLQFLGNPYGDWNQANDINANGVIAGMTAYVAWVWSPVTKSFKSMSYTGYNGLGTGGFHRAGLEAINDGGLTGGYGDNGSWSQAIIWNSVTGEVTLVPNANSVRRINSLNHAIAYSYGWNGYFWDQNTKTQIRIGECVGETVYDINDKDLVVGEALVGGNSRPYRWDPVSRNAYDLGTLGGAQGAAMGVNEAGDIVGWALTPTGIKHAVLWDAATGQIVDLGAATASGQESAARAINDNRQVAGQVGPVDRQQTEHAVLWTVPDSMPGIAPVGARLLCGTNSAPTAVIAPLDAPSFAEGMVVRFDGRGSSDPDHDALSYAWDFGDGSTGSGATPQHTYVDNGTYTVTLTVTDAQGASSQPVTTTVTVTNAAPAVSVDQSVTSVNVNAPFSLSFSFTDAGRNDSPWSYSIDWGDGTSATSGQATTQGGPITSSHTFTSAAQRIVQVTVTDKDGDRGAGKLSLTVVQTNRSPVADAGGNAGGPPTDKYAGVEGVAVAFSGARSSDPDGDALTYAWNFGDGTTGSGVAPSHVYGDNGTYTATLTVTDPSGASSSAQVPVLIANVNPRATFTATGPVVEGSPFTLALTNPIDVPADLPGLQYAFDCGDGRGYGAFSGASSASCATVDNGTRNVRAQIKDKDGGVSEYTGTVTVTNAAPVVAPLANATLTSGETLNLSGSFSDIGAQDSPWSTTINWGDGSAATTGSSSTQGTVSGTHRYTTAGTYTVTLSVTDKDGGVGSRSMTVTVSRLAVTIDIQPGKSPNSISLKKLPSTIPVLILSTATFDATTLDVSTLTLGDEQGTETSVARSSTGTLLVDTPVDYNGDGRKDVLVYFNTSELQSNGDLVLTAGTTQTLVLRGTIKLSDGRQVRGSDVIQITQ